MSTWLYQINPQQWSPRRYRLEIWEGERWAWGVGRKTAQGHTPEPGDVVVFFLSPSGGTEPGFYGWGIILEWYDDGAEMYFRPVAPSDQLKMHPWGDKRAMSLANRIRGSVKQGTLWFVPGDLERELRAGIYAWVGGTAGTVGSN